MFHKLSNTKQWELSIIFHTLLWSLFPIITILSYSNLSHLFSLAWSTLFSCIFFALMLTIKNKWWDFKIKNIWMDLLLTSIFIWILFYLFVFWWLSKTTAWNASIILLMEIFFSFVLFELFMWERSPKKHYLWAIMMAIWAFIILFPWKLTFNLWDLLILIWTMLAPVWNYFMRKVRKKVSSSFIMFFRSIISTIFLFILAYFISDIPTTDQLYKSFPYLIFSWFLLLWLSKIFWIEGVHRISIQKSVSMRSITPAFTIILAFFVLNEIPNLYQIIWFIPIFIWWILITRK